MRYVTSVTGKAISLEFDDSLVSFENTECHLEVAEFVDAFSFGEDGMPADNNEYGIDS